jgi:uncharacterized YigZ family protein
MERTDDTYLTLKAPCEGIFKDKGSKFLAFAFPVENEEEIKQLVQSLKKEHFSARHHCYAWRLGAKGDQFRANDDGEPSGTAGRPILGQLLSKNVTFALIVVVRYFGGTLLGVSGLINAYKSAAQDVLENGSVIARILEQELKATFEYPILNNVMKVIKDEQLEIVSTLYGDECEMIMKVRISKLECISNKLLKIDGVAIENLQ